MMPKAIEILRLLKERRDYSRETAIWEITPGDPKFVSHPAG
jgi:hypothetical protein